MKHVEYQSNNSGGSWWLEDHHWKALEDAGWDVEWDVEWLDALAVRAVKKGVNLEEAVSDWERVTGLSSTETGCSCCGPPHNFAEYDEDGKCINITT